MQAIDLGVLGLILSLGSLSLIAQTLPQTSSTLAACGNDNISFSVSRGAVGGQTESTSDKAMLYIIELTDLGDKGRAGRPLIRQGLDGKWIGATQGFTYVSTTVEPGHHHLCSHWQSSLRRQSAQISLNNFDAVAGKSYYFRVQIGYEATINGGAPAMIDLQPVSEDEGKFLISEAAQSISKPKK